jgi:hypothetical protein|tara:strand:+ start:55 stop:291 length:237 start_codon:yes stop_codon:yes gene_type:complete
MTEETNEMMDLLKELVGRVKQIEKTVYNNDNLLMKSGMVTTNTPVPAMGKRSDVPDSDTIAKMSWDDINDLVSRLGGE